MITVVATAATKIIIMTVTTPPAIGAGSRLIWEESTGTKIYKLHLEHTVQLDIWNESEIRQKTHEIVYKNDGIISWEMYY